MCRILNKKPQGFFDQDGSKTLGAKGVCPVLVERAAQVVVLVELAGQVDHGVTVAAGETGTFTTERACETPGIKTALATARNLRIGKTALARYECVEPPAVNIGNVTHPDSLGFDELGSLSFRVSRAEGSLPENVHVLVRHDNFEQSWNLTYLDRPYDFTLTLRGENLDTRYGATGFRVVRELKD